MTCGDLTIDKQNVLISSKHNMYHIIHMPFKHKGKQHESLKRFKKFKILISLKIYKDAIQRIDFQVNNNFKGSRTKNF